MRAYVDADILIWQLRTLDRADQFIGRMVAQGDSLWTGANQKAEILFHIRPGEERATRELLSLLLTHALTDEVIELGAQLYRRWSPSHGTGRDDALLAASTILGGGTLYTLNIRHFPMPGLDIVRPW